ncbi:hypothetical protein B0T20DRAFT_395381 [Sordaria brevicollis]|uniref:Uncharacterized protein n=1 Tax=Sordaria brevicollis TaxID=83679 RepID=A0AAE0U932_SORBR|nr:hypothetical protein B0T20DRAFT_395381 [Sordaria brevicollis]
MATRFTPINQTTKPTKIRLILSRLPEVSPSSPPMSPLSPPPSWYNDNDMECPHTPTIGSPPMSPLTPPPSWFNDKDMECPHSRILKQSSSLLAPLTDSPIQLKSKRAKRAKRSSLPPVLAGQALAPSALLFPKLSAPALQQNVQPVNRKRRFEEVGTEQVKHDPKAARREPKRARKTKKTTTKDEGTGLLTPVSDASGSPSASTTLDTIRVEV